MNLLYLSQLIANVSDKSLAKQKVAAALDAGAADTLRLWVFDNATIESLASRYGNISLQLLGLLFLIFIAIYALRAFEGLDLQGKVWDFALCALFIGLWPIIVVELKSAVDGFNLYLVSEIFHGQTFNGLVPIVNTFESLKSIIINWQDFFGPNGFFGQAGQSLVLNIVATLCGIAIGAAKIIIEVFYNAYFYFFVLLGPFVIARTIFSEHLEALLELLQEFLVVMLWPTTFLLIRGMNSLAQQSNPLGANAPEVGMMGEIAFQLSMIVMTLFVPSLTKKFCVHVGSSIISPLLRFAGIALGLTGAQGLASMAGRSIAGAGFHGFHFAHSAEKYISLGEIVHEHGHAQHAHHVAHKLHHALHTAEHAAHHAHEHHEHHDHHGHDDHHAHDHGGHDDHGGHGDHHEHGEHGGHSEHHEHNDHHEHHHDEHHEHSDHTSHQGHHEGHGGAHHAGHSGASSLRGGSSHGGSDSILPKVDLPAIAVDLEGTNPTPPTPTGGRGALDRFVWKPPVKSGLQWLGRIKKSFSKETSPENFAKERLKAREYLGPLSSDKAHDMEKCGIDHRDLNSNDFVTLKAYRKKVERFHNKFGWLYDFEGRFTGFDNQRPGQGKNPFQGDLNDDE